MKTRSRISFVDPCAQNEVSARITSFPHWPLWSVHFVIRSSLW